MFISINQPQSFIRRSTMNFTVCQIQFTQQTNSNVYLSNQLISHWKLNINNPLSIKLGNQVISANIKPYNKKGKYILLSSNVRQQLNVPIQGPTNVIKLEENSLQLGPLVGILTEPFGAVGSPFTSRSSFVKQLIQFGTNKAYVFGFTPEDINWNDKTVLGHFITSNGTWYRRKVNLPDVVYNRLPNRKKEITDEMTRFREKFIQQNIPIFNWSFLNKNDVYALLDQDPEALAHLPESHLNVEPEKLKEMLHKYRFVYFKPSTGSLGYGIYRITYIARKGYFIRYRANEKNNLVKFDSFEKMYRNLKIRVGRNYPSYVAQQGIRLIELDGCPVDFRFHMHKDGNNEWRAVGIGAKRAGKGSVTTHMRNGGKLLTPEQALKHAFGSRASQVLQYAKQISVRLSEAIERNYSHRIGELGLDIGIDDQGEVWMFEANAKPGRSIFKHPALKEEGKTSLQHLLEHCFYLSQFQGDEVK